MKRASVLFSFANVYCISYFNYFKPFKRLTDQTLRDFALLLKNEISIKVCKLTKFKIVLI
jgi:hypothetical protein